MEDDYVSFYLVMGISPRQRRHPTVFQLYLALIDHYMLSHMHVNERRCNNHKLNGGLAEAVITAVIPHFCLNQHATAVSRD